MTSYSQVVRNIVIIIMRRLTRRVSVIRMKNRRRGDHKMDLWVAVGVIKRCEFLFESVCSNVQVVSDDVR